MIVYVVDPDGPFTLADGRAAARRDPNEIDPAKRYRQARVQGDADAPPGAPQLVEMTAEDQDALAAAEAANAEDDDAGQRRKLKRLVEAERDRRMAAAGVIYDFGGDRGEHAIGTTARDRAGWDEVDNMAKAAIAAGIPAFEIEIRTDTGECSIEASEWPAFLLAVGAALQPIWKASWAVKDAVEAGTVTNEAEIAAHAAWPG